MSWLSSGEGGGWKKGFGYRHRKSGETWRGGGGSPAPHPVKEIGGTFISSTSEDGLFEDAAAIDCKMAANRCAASKGFKGGDVDDVGGVELCAGSFTKFGQFGLLTWNKN